MTLPKPWSLEGAASRGTPFVAGFWLGTRPIMLAAPPAREAQASQVRAATCCRLLPRVQVLVGTTSISTDTITYIQGSCNLTHEHSLDQGAGGVVCIGCHSCPCGVPPRHEVLPCQCPRASCDRGGHRGPAIDCQIAVVGIGVAAVGTVSFSSNSGDGGDRSNAAGNLHKSTCLPLDVGCQTGQRQAAEVKTRKNLAGAATKAMSSGCCTVCGSLMSLAVLEPDGSRSWCWHYMPEGSTVSCGHCQGQTGTRRCR